MENKYDIKRIEIKELEIIKELFTSVFTIEPWNDDWSDQEQLKKELGLVQIFLQTENNVPAYDFYRKNGFFELKEHVSFAKELT